MHLWHVVLPEELENIPRPHAAQAEPPVRVLYVPTAHHVHWVAWMSEYDPELQMRHTVFCEAFENDPAAQSRHWEALLMLL